MQATGRQPKRAPDGAPAHYERDRSEQTTLFRLVQQRRILHSQQVKFEDRFTQADLAVVDAAEGDRRRAGTI